ncbi:type IV toxin-antitoxin system AbiEi family antitoxin domain-containing protein [Aquipuribacter nitratireducens]|uniref:Type IV toxin-antitoxin system AbiEi family antitoxin domain-containing protein n=1 Tax=Aquipuribacter nitratireducens TaxID=650104 RepID=A0ABW0GM05_9MICO
MELPPPLTSLALAQDWVLTARQLRAAGLHPSEIQRHVASGRWVRVRRGVYLVEPEKARLMGAWVEARALALRFPGCVVAGLSAARVWQLKQVPSGPPEMVVRPGAALAARHDLRPRQWELGAGDVQVVRGVAVTTVARTLADLACTHDRLDVLPFLDAAVRAGRVTTKELLAIGQGLTGRPGASHVADLWGLVDGRAESGLESKVRLRCVDAELPPDAVQLEVRDHTGRLVARADLGYRLRRRRHGWLLVEADGTEVHAAPAALYRDRHRWNDVSVLDHVSLRFTTVDTIDPFTIPRAIRAAL